MIRAARNYKPLTCPEIRVSEERWVNQKKDAGFKMSACWNEKCVLKFPLCTMGFCSIPRLRVADGAPDAAVFFSRRIRHFLNYVSELMSCTHSHTNTHIHAHAHSSPCRDLRQTVYPLSPGLLTACYTWEREREREEYMNCIVYSRTQKQCKNVCDDHCLSLIILIWKVYYHTIRTLPAKCI